MTESRDIITTVTATPALMFTDEDVAKGLFVQIEAEIKAFEPDLSTAKGRGEIAALAFKVSRTKTAIDAAGAALIEDATKRVQTVNKERKAFRDRLDALRDEARKPLDDWETEQKAREARARATIDRLKNTGAITFLDTAAEVRRRYMELKAEVLDEKDLGEFAMIAKGEHKRALTALEGGYQRLVKDEADKAELVAMRKAEADRQRLQQTLDHIAHLRAGFVDGRPATFAILLHDLDSKIDVTGFDEPAASKIRNAVDEARGHLQGKLEDLRMKQAAEDAAAAEARAKAKATADAEAAAQAKVDAANAEAERLRQAEAHRLEVVERERQAQAARDADTTHRAEVIETAAGALLTATGLPLMKARQVIMAIAAGSVAGVSIKF